jgi:hypothetical protein
MPFTALSTVLRCSLSGTRVVSFLASSLDSRSLVLWLLYLFHNEHRNRSRISEGYARDTVEEPATHIFAARVMATRMSTPREEISLSQSCRGSTASGGSASRSAPFGGIVSGTHAAGVT